MARRWMRRLIQAERRHGLACRAWNREARAACGLGTSLPSEWLASRSVEAHLVETRRDLGRLRRLAIAQIDGELKA